MCEDWCHEECAGAHRDKGRICMTNDLFICLFKTTVGSYLSVILSNLIQYSLMRIIVDTEAK
jgi:hypothetical protein